jgi:hypothetical protein
MTFAPFNGAYPGLDEVRGLVLRSLVRALVPECLHPAVRAALPEGTPGPAAQPLEARLRLLKGRREARDAALVPHRCACTRRRVTAVLLSADVSLLDLARTTLRLLITLLIILLPSARCRLVAVDRLTVVAPVAVGRPRFWCATARVQT